ncbi:MAG: alcohol dehydrogenase [Acidimicrobiaceae bacterium]|nr:alcohol dehydrogenase [Acidimicrobiaceae bacterium]
MLAAVYDRFRQLAELRDVPEPACPPDGAVIAVRATGVCRSDWHAWMGHDPDIGLPHVPGHEFAGVIAEVGPLVERWKPGDRVTAPFVQACGRCAVCLAGNHNVCPLQTQPGFTRWGSFAEHVVVDWADTNLVGLPDQVAFVTAAGLGCRFATSYRAVVHHGRVEAGQWLAVYGCGGVGLAAVMVAVSRGVRVVAVDVSPRALALAETLGAEATLNAADARLSARVIEITDGGAHLSIDALGRAATLAHSIAGLRPRGRHVQIGLLLAGDAGPPVDMGAVVARELEIVGSHGMAAHHYPDMLDEIASGALDPGRLVARTIDLESAPEALATMDTASAAGTTVVLVGSDEDDENPSR